MVDEKIRCKCCERVLNPLKTVWLELDQRTNTYSDGSVPEEYSQGGFPFGVSCAKKLKALHKEAQSFLSDR